MPADGREHIGTSWLLALFPGLCIFTTALGINILGYGLRDILDPRLKRVVGSDLKRFYERRMMCL